MTNLYCWTRIHFRLISFQLGSSNLWYLKETYNDNGGPWIAEDNSEHQEDSCYGGYERQHEVEAQIYVLLPECKWNTTGIIR